MEKGTTGYSGVVGRDTDSAVVEAHPESCGGYSSSHSTLATLRAAIEEEEAALESMNAKRCALVAAGVLKSADLDQQPSVAEPHHISSEAGTEEDEPITALDEDKEASKEILKETLEIREAALYRTWSAALSNAINQCTTAIAQRTTTPPETVEERSEFLWSVPTSTPATNVASTQLGRDDYVKLSAPHSELALNHHLPPHSTTLEGTKRGKAESAAVVIREMSLAASMGEKASSSMRGLLLSLSTDYKESVEGSVAGNEDSDDGDSSDGYDEDYEREWRDQTGIIYAVCRSVESAIQAFGDVEMNYDTDMASTNSTPSFCSNGGEDPVVHPSERYLHPNTLKVMERLNRATSEFGDLVLALQKSRMVMLVRALSGGSDGNSQLSGSQLTLPLLPCEEEMIWGTVRLVFRHCDVAARKRWLTSTSRVASDLNFSRLPDIANGCFVIGVLGALDSEGLWADELLDAAPILKDRFISQESRTETTTLTFDNTHAEKAPQTLNSLLKFKPILSQRHRYTRLATMLRRLGGSGCGRRVRALQRLGVVEPTWGDVGISCLGLGGLKTISPPIRETPSTRGVCEGSVCAQKRGVPTLTLPDAAAIGQELVAL